MQLYFLSDSKVNIQIVEYITVINGTLFQPDFVQYPRIFFPSQKFNYNLEETPVLFFVLFCFVLFCFVLFFDMITNSSVLCFFLRFFVFCGLRQDFNCLDFFNKNPLFHFKLNRLIIVKRPHRTTFRHYFVLGRKDYNRLE